VSAVSAGGKSVYSNNVLYANLGGDPLYANIAEVRNVLLSKSFYLRQVFFF
jgi:hypothetical protein